MIVPIYKKEEEFNAISEKANEIKQALKAKGYAVKYDDRDTFKPGWKFAEYELKGVPVRIAIGPRDLENGTVEVARRDTKEKNVITTEQAINGMDELMESIHDGIFDKALKFREKNTFTVDTYDEFKEIINSSGGFVYAHWDGTMETEEKIKSETKATIRLIPMNEDGEPGKCIYTGKPSKQKVLFAKAY